ncbi:RNA polymerase sigma-70 factor [Flectobacillus sp. DC10W]|jgi:RNA polymerase sigma-70 factor (ECF subfamily)|uniref:RNA polymerase sigma-70 factor n=1 Tax=Flectobacillus longus TaxID=2984207 RepID=A0ABT6YI37_9BACT|nr:RNA polymerase sigma-70 factor [Flectobacillus longus]MDI9863253.1 RNA polymerase sigma-70 factor [Flectobacillus longus]
MTKAKFLDDSEIIQAWQAGDTDAFEILYQKYWRKLYSFARRTTPNAEDAQDLIQDVFAQLWMQKEQIDAGVFSESYLFAIVRNKLLDKIRKQYVREDYIQKILQSASESDFSTQQTILSNDLSNHLHQAVNVLPEKCKEVFQLSRFEQLTVDQIAQKLQLSPQTVKNQLSKALQVVRFHLREFATLGLFLLCNIF